MKKVLFFVFKEYTFTMKIFRIILCSILVGVAVLSLSLGSIWKNKKNSTVEPFVYQGILSVWNVDTFEGGVGSRKQFLLDSGVSFEKAHSGILIMVTSHTVYSAEENFKNGVYPDLISYGVGLDVQNVTEINLDSAPSVCKIGGKAYGAIWCRGGYVIIENPNYKGKDDKSLTVSKGEYTNPLVALALNKNQYNVISVKAPLDAYVDFTAGKSKYLLGTQRDICRLQNRGMNFNMEEITEFSDLNQFISVTALNENKRYYAEQFVYHLLSRAQQERLVKISMFSNSFAPSFESQSLIKMQSVKAEKSLSAFTKKEKLIQLNNLGLTYLETKSEETQTKIKNLLV